MSSTKGISRGLETLTAANYAILAALGIGVYFMGKSKSAQAATNPPQQPQQQPPVQGRPSIWRV
jgi:hypothetical protein